MSVMPKHNTFKLNANDFNGHAQRATVRLNQADMSGLDAYCVSTDCSRSEALRRAVKYLIDA